MSSRVVVRNPFPIPDVSSEGFWLAPGPILGDNITANDRTWSTRLDAHERLFAHHTLNSIRRDHRLVRTKVPEDALDLALTSTYVHNRDTLVPKMYVCMQPEALGRDTWRVLRNELKKPSPPAGLSVVGKRASADVVQGVKQNKESHKEKDERQSTNPTRAASAPSRSIKKTGGTHRRYSDSSRNDGIVDGIPTIHSGSLKLPIEGPHTEQTNPGYSRKEDGTFYRV